jgi:hypothetical protein
MAGNLEKANGCIINVNFAAWIIFVVVLFGSVGLATAVEPWKPPYGPMCFEKWISEYSRLMNSYDGDKEFNSRKPWRINKYGLFVGQKMYSNYAPDDWGQYGANRHQWMWGHNVSESKWFGGGAYNKAGLQGLRYFVRNCIKQAGGTIDAGLPQTPPSAPSPSTQVCPQIPVGSGMADCPTTFSSFSGTQIVVGCNCPPNFKSGRVWGSGVYTADSSICTAARHAGAIGKQGGPIWVQGAPGRSNYQGTTQNGITTGDYGNYGASFHFPVAGTTIVQSPNVSACPGNSVSMRGKIGQRNTCHCAPDRMVGSVWGSGIYTDDSSLCAAALHAGVVSASGGTVSYTIFPGQESYHGSSRNGISTKNYGKWKGSYRFE